MIEVVSAFTVIAPIFLTLVIIWQEVRIKWLKRHLLAWREDTLRCRSRLDVRRFPEIDRALQNTLDVIDGALRR